MAARAREREIKMTPAAMEMQNKMAMAKVHETKSKAELQLEREWNRFLEHYEKGNYKAAIEALKMYNFISKMCALADRFVIALERVQSIQSLFDMLQSTGEVFGQIMSLDNAAVMKDMKKNLGIFKKKLKEYERNMTEIFDVLDNLFDEKPNIFVRFINWITGKKPESDKEMLDRIMREHNISVDGTTRPAGGDAGKPEEKGGTTGGNGDGGDWASF